ncbi:hypothetical protein BDW75DRAFT_245960 [Aspergillus navahoensis]
MPTIIFIVVFRCELLDVVEFRDVALYTIYSDGRQALIHPIGTPGFFNFANQEANDPRNSANFAGLVLLSLVKDSISRAAIEAICARTPVQNNAWRQGWNSQDWICQALARLQSIGCLTDQERFAAIDKMKNIILQAEDEPMFTTEPLHLYRT